MIRWPHRRLAAALATASLSVSLLVTAAPTALAGGAAPEVGKEIVPVIAPAPSSVIETKVSREDAVAIARRLFDIPASLGDPTVNKSQSKQMASWSLNWQSPEKEPDRMVISVGIDAVTGKVLNYYKSVQTAEPSNAPPVYTRDDALTFARQWMMKLTAPTTAEFRLVEQPVSYGYYGPVDAAYGFRWERMEQGYPVHNDGVNLSIDSRTGELKNFNYNEMRQVTYTLPSALISRAKAEGIYREQVPMQLYYQRFNTPGTDQGEWKLVYRPQLNGYPAINQEGQALSYDGTPMDLSVVKETKLVPAPATPWQAPKQLMTEAEALALAVQVSGQQEKPTSVNYNEYGKDASRNQSWEFFWSKPGELKEGEKNVNVRIDAARGVVMNYSAWGPYEPMKKDEKPKLTLAEAREKAFAFVQTYRPDLAGAITMMPGDPREAERMLEYGGGMYSVGFNLMMNGVMIADRTGNVQIDARTGEISGFYINDRPWEGQGEDKFPEEPANVLKPGDAMESFLKSQGVELAWSVFYPQADKIKMMSGEAPEPYTLLVWSPSNNLPVAAIDAVTGAPLDWEGRNLIEMAQRPSDIAGHFAQREIELLWARRVINLKDGKFRPDEQATASELAQWLVLAKGMRPYPMYNFSMAMGGRGPAGELAATKLANDTNAAYFGAAMKTGIILPEDFDLNTDPKGPVSRELFALWAVRAMGYGSIARMPNRIAASFTDMDQVDAKFANAVAILNGLGVAKGDAEGKFNPARPLTRGEAAKFLFAVASEVRR